MWCILLLTGHNRFYSLEFLLIDLAFIGAFRSKLLHFLFAIRWVNLVSGMCYSIYLWHFFVLALVFKISRRVRITNDLFANLLLQSTLLPCILAFSVTYFVLIERPCMDPAWPQKVKIAIADLIGELLLPYTIVTTDPNEGSLFLTN